MTEACVNPNCANEMPTVGVCLACVRSDYNPLADGVSLEWEPYTTGGITNRSQTAIRNQLRETHQVLKRLELLGGGSV